MPEYSDGFKAKMVQRLAGPRAITAAALSRETGIPQPTLSAWLRQDRGGNDSFSGGRDCGGRRA
jgi:transposase-like protein